MDPGERCNAGEIVDRQVARGRGEALAVVAEDATLTYDELRRQINRAAGVLRELGVRREQRVLLVLDDTSVFPIVFLGAMRMGAVPVPVSALDKAENFRHYVADSYAEVVVTDAPLLEKLSHALEDSSLRYLVRGGDGPGVIELDDALRGQPTSSTRSTRIATTWRSGSTAPARPASRRASSTCTTTSG